ncbi:MAG: hypothetical protein J6B93_06890 [Clostridia bacterium]|nr:hypothetical protein [Clostridia bacterium]
MSENIHVGHRDRLRKELLSKDITENIAPEKLLELLLFYGIPRQDTAPMARELLARFGGLGGVFEAELEELCKVKGMTYNAACLIRMMRPVGRAYLLSSIKPEAVLKNSGEIGSFIHTRFYGIKEEHIGLLCLNNLGQVTGFEFLAKGGIESVGITPRKVVEVALKHKAAAVVLAHNHPGGVAIPSPQDIELTKTLAEVLSAVSIVLLDHIIVIPDDYVSMAATVKLNGIFGVLDE